MGYYPGPLDGAFGPMTRRAIRNYQFDYGLPVTGRLDYRHSSKLGSLKAAIRYEAWRVLGRRPSGMQIARRAPRLYLFFHRLLPSKRFRSCPCIGQCKYRSARRFLLLEGSGPRSNPCRRSPLRLGIPNHYAINLGRGTFVGLAYKEPGFCIFLRISTICAGVGSGSALRDSDCRIP